MYHFIYTIYKEPEHEIVLENVIARTCREYFGLGENGWDYFREKIECGKIPEYSLTKYKNTDKPGDEEAERLRHRQSMWDGLDGELCGNWQPGKVVGLCGDCRQWQRYPHRSRSGKLYGVCGRTGQETEKCAWCSAKR